MNSRITLADQLRKKLEEMDVLVNLLLADTNISNELLGQQLLMADKTGDLAYINALIRMRVRATVSMFESICYYFRHLSRGLCVLWKREISEDYRKLDDDRKMELKDKIKLSLRFLVYALGKDTEIDVTSSRWQRLCDLIEKRHHLTHPNCIDDLQVSEKDLENANMAMFWFVDFVYKLMGKETSKEYIDLQKQILILSKGNARVSPPKK